MEQKNHHVHHCPSTLQNMETVLWNQFGILENFSPPKCNFISNLLNLQATAPTSGREHCILNYKQLKLLSLSEVGESDFNFSTFEIITFGRSFQSIFPIFQIFHTVFRLGPVCFNCDLLLLLCLTFFRLQKVLIVCSINCWNNTSGDISEWKLGQIFSFWCFSLTNVLFWVILPFGAFAILMFSYWRFISRLRLDQNCPQDDKDRLHVLNAVNSAWLTTPIFQSMFTFLYDLWLSNISAMIEQWSPMNNFSLDWEITGQHFGLNFLLTESNLVQTVSMLVIGQLQHLHQRPHEELDSDASLPEWQDHLDKMDFKQSVLALVGTRQLLNRWYRNECKLGEEPME